MKLNFKKLGGGKPIIIMHGLFGASDNWLTVGKKLADHNSVYLLDLRNHGQSPHSDDFSFNGMVEDLLEFRSDHNLENISLVGHSLGGKIAMKYALRFPRYLDKLVIVDISPIDRNSSNIQFIVNIIQAMKTLDFTIIQSRKQADESLMQEIPNLAIRQFLLKNLTREKDNSLTWKLNLSAIEQNIQILREGVFSKKPFSGPTLFLRGGNSDYIPLQDEELIPQLFPDAKISTIAGAGHWVHADAPVEVTNQILSFLSNK